MNKIYQDYNVHKFGGSSLADAKRFAAVKSILTGHHEIIIVSAIKGVTSALQSILDIAKDGSSFLGVLSSLENSHLTLIATLLSADNGMKITASIQKDMREIKEILHAIQLTCDYSKKTRDLILGYGEVWSAKILTQYLSDHFYNVVYLDASVVLFVYEKQGIVCIDWQKSKEALENFLENKIFDQIVITGFIAATLEGRRTILGRNSSDFSAAIFARLFGAKSLTIWTDVNGIFTSDPQKVRSAFVIDALSYREALELAYFGAKVLHPMTVLPLCEQQLPIYIKNSFNPEVKGTCISNNPYKSSYLIKGLTYIDNVTLINIEGNGAISGIATRIFQVLHQTGIPILISQVSSEYSICIAISNPHADTMLKELNENLQFEIERQQIKQITIDKSYAILAAIGDNMIGTLGVSGKLCTTLAKANINIRAISQGSSERNISVVINNDDINKALQAVHAGFYFSCCKTLSVGLIGPGQVGSALLHQFHEELESLKKKYQINLWVRGIMNSSKMLLSHEPIDLRSWHEQFNESNVIANVDRFIKHILADDVPHAVIIDCTANQTIAQMYLEFLKKGIHIITPNKYANAGDLNYSKQLKAISHQKNCHYLYETTVCAGLPVIHTLQDLIKTGDEVLKIEGIVSGTLSFIFNELAKGRRFSEIVLEARARGLTEPDPREDLSGMDVARKLVCLAREIGHEVSLDSINVYDLVPAKLKSCSLDEFLAKISFYDDSILASLIAKVKTQNEKLCYVGTIHQNGSIQVTVDSFSQKHPFSRLQGTDNMLVFHTRRYDKQPLIIQGPGAGAEVTAAGIFADLLRLVSYLS